MRKSNPDVPKPKPSRLRCGIYTRKSTEEGLDQEFNSLDSQREAAEAFIQSQRREGWIALPESYDDGGFTGANMDRPALTRLLHAVEAGEVDCVVVYKVDRLSRSLLDFTRMLSLFEKHQVSFVAVTQQFNTSTSLGRLTLNILLSFAQFERELAEIERRARTRSASSSFTTSRPPPGRTPRHSQTRHVGTRAESDYPSNGIGARPITEQTPGPAERTVVLRILRDADGVLVFGEEGSLVPLLRVPERATQGLGSVSR